MASEIFHYTNFETFKKIVKSRRIRFGPLCKVDDAEEGHLFDSVGQGRYTFVSCWAKNSDDNIPLWNMYTSEKFAVRIGIDPNFITPLFESDYFFSNHDRPDALVAPLCSGEVTMPPLLQEVRYVDNPGMCMTKNLRGMFSDDYLKHYGITKRASWAFQSEVRYAIQAIPRKKFLGRSRDFIAFKEWIINDMGTDIDYVHVDYDFSFMERANILLGPSTTEEHRDQLMEYLRIEVPNYSGNILRSSSYVRERIC